jgi:hypothetical protein
MTLKSSRQRISGRSLELSETAPTVDENAGHLAGGRVAAHHDADVAARLEDRIEDLGGRAPAPPGYLGESAILH